MTISVIVQRIPGDYQGKDITDALIATEAQAVERGRVEIERTCSDRFSVSGSCPMLPYMQPGKIVQVTDLDGSVYRAMIRNFALSIDRQSDKTFTAQSSVVLEREA